MNATIYSIARLDVRRSECPHLGNGGLGSLATAGTTSSVSQIRWSRPAHTSVRTSSPVGEECMPSRR
jgi:hypothetical protein